MTMILFEKNYLQKHKLGDWPPAVLKDVNRKYHIILKQGQPQIMNIRLIFYKPVMMNIKYLALIYVPQSLRKLLFDHYHYGPTGGYMG